MVDGAAQPCLGRLHVLLLLPGRLLFGSVGGGSGGGGGASGHAAGAPPHVRLFHRTRGAGGHAGGGAGGVWVAGRRTENARVARESERESAWAVCTLSVCNRCAGSGVSKRRRGHGAIGHPRAVDGAHAGPQRQSHSPSASDQTTTVSSSVWIHKQAIFCSGAMPDAPECLLRHASGEMQRQQRGGGWRRWPDPPSHSSLWLSRLLPAHQCIRQQRHHADGIHCALMSRSRVDAPTTTARSLHAAPPTACRPPPAALAPPHPLAHCPPFLLHRAQLHLVDLSHPGASRATAQPLLSAGPARALASARNERSSTHHAHLRAVCGCHAASGAAAAAGGARGAQRRRLWQQRQRRQQQDQAQAGRQRQEGALCAFAVASAACAARSRRASRSCRHVVLPACGPCLPPLTAAPSPPDPLPIFFPSRPSSSPRWCGIWRTQRRRRRRPRARRRRRPRPRTTGARGLSMR